MIVHVYTEGSIIEFTDIDRTEVCGSFFCLYEGETVYRYPIFNIEKVIENPKDEDL